MPFSAQSSPRHRRAYTVLSLLLAGVAGAVNATGFVALGLHTSHMSGNMATLGESLASRDWRMAMLGAQVLLAFLLGAVAASALMEAARHRARGRHAPALLLEAVILGGIGVWLTSTPGTREPTLMWGLSFAMGLQNALVTRVSGAVVRTTHITGVLTDIGIQVVQMFAWVRDGARGDGFRGVLRQMRALPSAIQFERTRLHLGLAAAFLFGCTTGPMLYLQYGPATLGLPCAVLVLLAALDLSPAALAQAEPAPRT
ncbi:YoaK family protein [Pyxidicoccus trucidator]|uniref:YoaK family protein n=1 Tax=Pyxidicoccus trucidator TaxID=2709662 RepID=UPI0013DBEC08|nr:YoaK family protein [Pyxidicoccus trucidator]